MTQLSDLHNAGIIFTAHSRLAWVDVRSPIHPRRRSGVLQGSRLVPLTVPHGSSHRSGRGRAGHGRVGGASPGEIDVTTAHSNPAWLHSVGMAIVLFDAIERAQLCDLLDELGPEAPTLLEPWTTRDLAAHLVLREHDHPAGPGLVLPGMWGRFAERRRRALTLRDFSWLVATIRSGPPPGFFRIGWVRRVPNLNEFFVHHEDVRRANGRDPRTNEHAMDEAPLGQRQSCALVPRTATARCRTRASVDGDR
jgi:uncharacterized protein (TIGR03085 family)